MNYAYSLIGAGVPVIKRYKISATLADPGVYVTVATAGVTGLVKGITTTVAGQVGVTVDTATYSTTQGDAEAVASVIVNPSAVYRLRLAGGATAGTQGVITTNITANTDGLIVTKTGASGVGDPDPNSPTMDEGLIVCIGGANVGQSRKITSVAATTATVIVPFVNDIAVGDVFILCPYMPGDTAADNIQTTSNIVEADHTVAVGTGADLRPIEVEFDTADLLSARRNSFVYAYLVENVLVVGT